MPGFCIYGIISASAVYYVHIHIAGKLAYQLVALVKQRICVILAGNVINVYLLIQIGYLLHKLVYLLHVLLYICIYAALIGA